MTTGAPRSTFISTVYAFAQIDKPVSDGKLLLEFAHVSSSVSDWCPSIPFLSLFSFLCVSFLLLSLSFTAGTFNFDSLRLSSCFCRFLYFLSLLFFSSSPRLSLCFSLLSLCASVSLSPKWARDMGFSEARNNVERTNIKTGTKKVKRKGRDGLDLQANKQVR